MGPIYLLSKLLSALLHSNNFPPTPLLCWKSESLKSALTWMSLGVFLLPGVQISIVEISSC